MAYTIKARFYSEADNFGESYVIQSDNADKDTKLEVGTKIIVEPLKNTEHKICEECKGSGRSNKYHGEIGRCESCKGTVLVED